MTCLKCLALFLPGVALAVAVSAWVLGVLPPCAAHGTPLEDDCFT